MPFTHVDGALQRTYWPSLDPDAQAAPSGAGWAHLPLVPVVEDVVYWQYRPVAHLTTSFAVELELPHSSPSFTVFTATHTDVFVEPSKDDLHDAPVTHPPSGHGSPICAAGAHFPHVELPWVGVVELVLHWPLAH